MKSEKQIGIINRLTSKTPSFFAKLRNIGLIVTAGATAILTAPITLPSIVITLASYFALAGGVVSAVSQAAVDGE